MGDLKRRYDRALPFAMDPVVYDFKLNYEGIMARANPEGAPLMPAPYYRDALRNAFAQESETWTEEHAPELELLAERLEVPESPARARRILDRLDADGPGPEASTLASDEAEDAEALRIKKENGFDVEQHESLKRLLKSGKIGTSRNRLPRTTLVEDVGPDHVEDATVLPDRIERDRLEALGRDALRAGKAAVVTFSGGLGSRWTEGAAVVKPINPFVMMAGRHRSFTEIHLAKSRRASIEHGRPVQHVFTTSFLTHEPFEEHLEETGRFGYEGPVHLSRARAIGHRVYPMERDLRFLWEELPQQMLDEQQQKIIEDYHEAIIEWTRERGEGEDYTGNVARQRFNPPGHWHEIPNLLKNGTLARMLEENPELDHLLAHNADTLGAVLDPVILGMHLRKGATLTFEVTPRRFEDKGGGLALVDGRPQLMEALALPREEDEFKLSYYNTLTSWIRVDGLLVLFGLTRTDVIAAASDEAARRRVDEAVRNLAGKVPTYVTIKEVKYLWGAGQEDVFPVAQFEKLWGDMSRLPEVDAHFVAVPRKRGQQLKDPAQLDRWVADGSCRGIEELAAFA